MKKLKKKMKNKRIKKELIRKDKYHIQILWKFSKKKKKAWKEKQL